VSASMSYSKKGPGKLMLSFLNISFVKPR
jgi:hypothetical protein